MSSRPALPTAEEIGTLVPIGRIAEDTPYSADFLRQLARSGKLRAYKLNRDWLTTPAAVHDYLKSQTKRHEKALSLLQAAEKAFLAIALLVIVFSVAPEARAQSLSNPPPAPSEILAVFHQLTASWKQFAGFSTEEFSAARSRINVALHSLGYALLGKTAEEYLADAPVQSFALAKHQIEPRGPEMPNTARSAVKGAAPRVLGVSTSRPAVSPETAATLLVQVQGLIDQALQRYLASGKFTGPQGPPGPSGPSSSGIVQNGNGQTTAVIGGQPIVTYIPSYTPNNYTGGSLAGFTNLSGQNMTAGNQTVTGQLTVNGSSSFAGSLTAATSTLSTLTVTGPSTFSGSTTIAGLTVTTFNPGLTLGSVAFQGASGLTQDNVSFFYDATNHRLGLGTTTPSQLLAVAGNALVTGNATTSGNQTISGTLNVAGASTLSTTTATNFTASGPATLQNTLSVTATSTLATVTATSLTTTGNVVVGANQPINNTDALEVYANSSKASFRVYNQQATGYDQSALQVQGHTFYNYAFGPNYAGSTGFPAGGDTLEANGPGGLNLVADNASGTIALFTGAAPTEQMIITTSGNLGLGTTTPGSQLVTTGGVQFANFGTGLLHTSNVGLLSSSPVNLSIGDVTGVLPVGNGGTGAATLNQYDLLAGNGSNAMATITPGTVYQVLRSAGASADPTYSDIASLLTAGSNITLSGTSTIAVSANPSFTGTTSVATLTTTGNVGIGTTSPVSKLEVYGGNLVLSAASHELMGQGAGYDCGNCAGSGTVQPYDPVTGNTILNNGAYGIKLQTAGSDKLTILNNGSVGIGTSTPTLGPLTMASGAYVSSGGTWTNASDRNLKENFATLSPASVLEKIDQLPVTEWNYKSEGPTVNHIGPVAQDFWAAFRLGNSSTSLSTIDPAGVALLGIQALDQKIQALQGSPMTSTTITTANTYGAPLSVTSVTSPASFSGDSVGEAKILPGQTSVRVTFTQPYQYQPIVTMTLEGTPTAVFGSVNNINSGGFTIQTLTVVTSTLTFAWHSFASPAEQLTVSDGSTAGIPLISPPAPQSTESSPPTTTLPVTSTPSPAPLALTTQADSTSSTPNSTASTASSGAPSLLRPPAILGTSTTTPSAVPNTVSPPALPDPAPPTTPNPAPRAVTPHSPSRAPTSAPSASSEASSPSPAPSSAPSEAATSTSD